MFEQEEHDIDALIDENQLLNFVKNTEKLTLINLLSELPIPTAILDLEGRFISSNQLFSDIYQSDALYLIGKLLYNFAPEMTDFFKSALSAFHQGETRLEHEIYFKGHFLNAYFKPLKNENQNIEAIVIVYVDVTHLKRRERILELSNKRLQENLYLDPITGLRNKLSFSEFFENLLISQKTGQLSVLKIDLDDFKKFNQLYSYTEGDIVLAEVAHLLKDDLIDDQIHLFRVGSASFMIMTENQSEWQVLTLAERLKQIVFEQQLLFEYSDMGRITVSIGILQTSLEQLTDEGSLLQYLDLAVRQAKTSGKNQISLLKIS